MKKKSNKKYANKFVFSILIILCFIMFIFLTNGIGLWDGLVEKIFLLFEKIYKNTYYGMQFIYELIWFLLLIPIILIFKNKYIFKQKKIGLCRSLLLAWPLIIFSIIALIRSINQVDLKIINVYEIIALLLYTILIGLFEEIMCRGWLQNEFMERFGNNRKGIIFSILISGSIFGLLHIINIFFGQNLFNTLIQVLSAALVGISLGAIYFKTKNIWSVIIIHAFWDFAVFFESINMATTCVYPSSSVETITPILGIFSVFLSLFISFPEIGTIFLLLNKKSINDELNDSCKSKISKEDIKKSKNIRIIFSILICIFLIGYFIEILFMGALSTNQCPNYKLKNPENYSEQIINYNNYNLLLEKVNNIGCNLLDKDCNNSNAFNYNFNISDNNEFIIVNKIINKEIKLKYENVFNFAIFENDNIYDIVILSVENNGNTIIYYSHFISEDNIKNDEEYLKKIGDSFKQLKVPATIIDIGYYEDDKNINKMPLFISSTETRYLLSNNDIIYEYKS